MKRLVIIFLLGLFISFGCATMSDIVDKKIAKKIPENSDTIRIVKNSDVKDLFNQIFKKLSKKGWVISNKNIIDNFATIATKGKK